MTTIANELSALRSMSRIDEKADSLNRFRSDFKRVFEIWCGTADISHAEARRQMAEAGAAVQAHMHDAEWMDCAAKHIRELIEQYDIDRARSVRIAAEVRAEREEKKTRKSA